MTHMDHHQKTITDWAQATFPRQTELTIAAHLLSEAAELYKALGGEAIRAAQIVYEAKRGERPAEEVADVVILALAAGGYLNVSVEAQVADKMRTNKVRKWNSLPNKLGFHEHIGEAKA